MIDAGKYNHKIEIYGVVYTKDLDGFQHREEQLVLTTWAEIKTTKGTTIIRNDSDFERAYTRFVIRYPKTEINRDMIIKYAGKVYTIVYLNNMDEAAVELEIQAKEVTH